MSLWAERVLPRMIEKACRSTTILAERRRWVPRAHGRVLELGVGSGLNLAFYDRDRVERVDGIDPSPALLARARPRAAEAPVAVELHHARAEALPFADATFDTALVTYTLCSIADPAAAMRELRRVLRPGADLVFVEHGRAPDRATARWQRWLTPAWRRIGGNCHLDRDIPALLRDGGLTLDHLESGYSDGARLLGYTYQGLARR